MAVAEHLIAPTDGVRAAGAAPAKVAAAARHYLQRYFLALSLLGLGAFVLGVGNRFTADGTFLLPPLVDWIPPFSAGAWNEAFAVHQQDPVFAACGGTESLSLFKTLYWWEWLRRGFLIALGGGAILGLFGAAAWPRFAFALPPLVALAAVALAYWPARWGMELLIGASPTLSSFNVGQYRHALAVGFAGAALAGVIACAIAPPDRRGARGPIDRSEWIWIAAILADIAFGALFAARDAAASWSTLLGYDGHALPPLAQLFSYSPWWLNLTFNALTIQLVHRSLSTALWIAAAWQLVVALRSAHGAARAGVRFALLTAQMLTGIATLALGVPAALSIAHQVGAVLLLAASFAFLLSGRFADKATPPLPQRWSTT